ncbi:MAG: hypothetical protein ACLGH3_04760 [Actinomycetota bacterium]
MAELRIISREEAGLVPPRYRNLISTPSPRLWLHHSAGALDAGGNGVWWDDVRGIQDFHMRPKSQGGRGWSDIAYSFLVGGGQVFEGRGAGIAGGHTAGDNTSSHAICLIGDYTWMVPKQEDLEAIAWLMAHGKAQGWWGDLTGPHRDAPGAQTACCGTNLIACIPDLRHMATEGSSTSTPTPTPIPSEEDDFMVIITAPNRPPRLYGYGGTFVPVSKATTDNARLGGIRSIHLATNEYDKLLSQVIALLHDSDVVEAIEGISDSDDLAT